MAKNKRLGFLGWVAAVLIPVALINWGLLWWFDFNILTWVSAGNDWITHILVGFVVLFGLSGFTALLYKVFK